MPRVYRIRGIVKESNPRRSSLSRRVDLKVIIPQGTFPPMIYSCQVKKQNEIPAEGDAVQLTISRRTEKVTDYKVLH